MSSSNKARPALGELEQKVMDYLWSRGPASAEQVREALASSHPMKESTTRTIVLRLERKGYLKHTLDGRTHIYSGVDQPRNVAARAVRQLIDRFCGGSLEQLLVGMVDDRVVDHTELEQIARRIAREKRKG
jgi:predicted transcriptional regulator